MAFDVTTKIELGDLTDVKQDQFVLPPAQVALFSITKAEVSSGLLDNQKKEGLDNPAVLKFLNLAVKLVEGIEVEGELKYRGKVLFPSMFCWANPEIKTSDWYKKRKHLVELKTLLIALGYDPTNPPSIDDDFLIGLVGKEVRGNIIVKFKQQKQWSEEKGKFEYVDTAEKENVVKDWKAA